MEQCVLKLLEISNKDFEIEIIVVDDCSNDNSYQIAIELAKKNTEISVCKHKLNLGKGAAIRTGLKKITGDFVAIQDADLEYNPKDLKKLLVPLINNDADVVLGSRFLTDGIHRVLYFWHYIGNRFLTLLSNLFTNLNISDMETCYKVFRRQILEEIELKENRFGFEPEIVAKISHRNLRIYETGISYYGRTYEEGKKIKPIDGLKAIYYIIYYNAYKSHWSVQLVLFSIIWLLTNAIDYILYSLLYLNQMIAFDYIIIPLVNYYFIINILFRRGAKWNLSVEIPLFIFCFAVIKYFKFLFYKYDISLLTGAVNSIVIIDSIFIILNFIVIKFVIFPKK